MHRGCILVHRQKTLARYLGCRVEISFVARGYADQAASSATELAGLSVPKTQEDARGPFVAYETLISSGQLRQDARQESTVMELERLYQDLIAHRAKSGKGGSGLTLIDASPETSW